MDKYIDFKISRDTVIHVPTERLAKKVSKVLDRLGATWLDDTRYTEDSYWHMHKANTCYHVHDGGIFCNKQIYIEYGFKIITAEDFLKLHKQSTSNRFFKKLKRVFNRA